MAKDLLIRNKNHGKVTRVSEEIWQQMKQSTVEQLIPPANSFEIVEEATAPPEVKRQIKQLEKQEEEAGEKQLPQEAPKAKAETKESKESKK